MNLCGAVHASKRIPLATSTRELPSMIASHVHAAEIGAHDATSTTMARALATFPSRALYGFGALLTIMREADICGLDEKLNREMRQSLAQIVARQDTPQGFMGIIRTMLYGLGFSSLAYKKAVHTVANFAHDRLRSETPSIK